ncbi:FadR/GntR family transcriptional regulator [Bacillus sp. FJAT-50079]|uniref:FadR/GntR family transcriptional regulator n=1 Tax=Bacillus sp. FJAT-50079 TaxID=2833577 RepID=UPI001BC8D352|nr:FadR/GntR family transcriptional regulator [Bacillus sp. FJAT-50079]MBS4210394.1 FadR family transcriptional regulator [Bacillus sp. FJAT-50079]
MKYTQIKQQKLYEKVAEALHGMIRSGQLKPGDKLDSVQQLAENFQVGRSAIREALSALRAMGLVEMKQGEGTYIKQFSPDQIAFPLSTAILMNKKDVTNLLEVRKIIESGTAASASQNRSEANLQAMEAALQEMKLASGNEELGEKADLAFHLAIAEASQNQLLSSLLHHVSELMQETMKETRRLWLYSKQTTTEKLYEEHKKIYEAIVRGNDEEARETMLEHLENVEVILSEYIQGIVVNEE